MKKRVILTVIAAVLCGLVPLYFLVQRAAAPTAPANTQTEEQKPPVTQPKNIILSLPGATPIEARVEDYNNPASNWILVSKDYPLVQPQYKAADLVIITSVKTRPGKSAEERSLRAVLVEDLNAMFADAASAGHDFMISSGFRSYTTQASLYNSYVASSGDAAANTFSAKPGQSEHQTGLSFDIRLSSGACYLDVCFGNMPAGQWLAANAPSYGFIIRYPADKTAVTKYQYEPWHLRYVGRPLAGALKQSGLTLDEAQPYLQQARSELLEAKLIHE